MVKTKQLRELHADTRAAKMLGQALVAELARWSLENADLRRRLRRNRVSRRQQALKLGFVAGSLVVAGLIAKRARSHPAEPAA